MGKRSRENQDELGVRPSKKKKNLIEVLAPLDVNVSVKKEINPNTDIKDLKQSSILGFFASKTSNKTLKSSETCNIMPKCKKENFDVKVEKKSSSKSKPSVTGKVLQSLGSDVGAGSVIKKLLPSPQRVNADKVAAFALFLHQRQEILVARTQNPSYTNQDTKNDILRTYFFTNIYREADTGTKFYRQQMLLQYQEIGCNELPNIVFQTVVYRLINKKLTFETFGKIPSADEWVEFKNFFQEEMRLSKSDSKREKPFTAAHQVMGLDKLMDTIEFVLKNKEKISRDLKAAKSLEKCFLIFQEINNIGGFLAWQITADLSELKLIKFSENIFTCLGPGAKNGLATILNVVSSKEELELTKQLTKSMESIFNAMEINFKYFLGKKLTLKTVEHALCEFFKYWRAVQEGRSKRKYHGMSSVCVSSDQLCCLCTMEPSVMIDNIWLLCSRCYSMEAGNIGSLTRTLKIESIKCETE